MLNAAIFLGLFLYAPIMNLSQFATGSLQQGFIVLGAIALIGAGAGIMLLRKKPTSEARGASECVAP